MRLRIDVTRDLPVESIEALLTESATEGWRHVGRLYEEWQRGFNRFQQKGEVLCLAREEQRVIAVGGVNIDPYATSPRVGRVRRLYVLAAFRRRGVGLALIDRLIHDARESFDELRLRASSAGAAAFFERLGFAATTHLAEATHRLVLP